MAVSDGGAIRRLLLAGASLRRASPQEFDRFHQALEASLQSLLLDQVVRYTGTSEGLWLLRGAAGQLSKLVDDLRPTELNKLP